VKRKSPIYNSASTADGISVAMGSAATCARSCSLIKSGPADRQEE
jgi:hypothetical protein